jgi:hypothetical protein
LTCIISAQEELDADHEVEHGAVHIGRGAGVPGEHGKEVRLLLGDVFLLIHLEAAAKDTLPAPELPTPARFSLMLLSMALPHNCLVI